MIDSCTGLQDNLDDLESFLRKHPEYDQDIFNINLDDEFNER